MFACVVYASCVVVFHVPLPVPVRCGNLANDMDGATERACCRVVCFVALSMLFKQKPSRRRERRESTPLGGLIDLRSIQQNIYVLLHMLRGGNVYTFMLVQH